MQLTVRLGLISEQLHLSSAPVPEVRNLPLLNERQTVKVPRQKRRSQSILIPQPINMLLLLLLAVGAVLCTPVPPQKMRVLYDQRQEGEWNVNADFKNIVVMVIPTQTSSGSNAASTLLDFLLRTVPKRSQLRKLQKKKAPAEETMHFIESKTAPYHVDISRSKSHLAKLHPEVPPVVRAEEIVIAKSPAVELVKDGDSHHRAARAFVVTVPEEELKKKEVKKNINFGKSMLKLLGAENEQCGPGLARDEEGVCRTLKN